MSNIFRENVKKFYCLATVLVRKDSENVFEFSKLTEKLLGAASVHYHMLNAKSRDYFTRAFLSSSSAFNNYALRRRNHVKLIQKCTQLNDTNQMIEYLKRTEMAKILYACYPLKSIFDVVRYPWVPTIEMQTTPGAFLTKTPNEIYNSNEAPAMDAMFDFMAEV